MSERMTAERLAELELRAERLEAERDDCTRVNRDMCAENVRLKAKLEAIRKLPSREFNARRFPYSSLGAWVRVKGIERILQEQQDDLS